MSGTTFDVIVIGAGPVRVGTAVLRARRAVVLATGSSAAMPSSDQIVTPAAQTWPADRVSGAASGRSR